MKWTLGKQMDRAKESRSMLQVLLPSYSWSDDQDVWAPFSGHAHV